MEALAVAANPNHAAFPKLEADEPEHLAKVIPFPLHRVVSPPIAEYEPLPAAIEVTKKPGAQEVTRVADEFINAVGRTAISIQVEKRGETNNETPIDSLKDATHLAAEGNLRAEKVMRANISSDVSERTIKVRYVTPEIELETDRKNDIHQHGHSMKKVQLNAWQFAAGRRQMRERVAAENRNVFHLQHSYNQGELEGGVFVELSMAADNMDEESMDKVGFFTDTMSCVIRVTTVKDGVLTMQSAFVAGVKKSGRERHDHKAIASLGKALGMDFEGKSATEILGMPFILQDDRSPEEVLIDLVKLYDRGAGGTFFGEAKPVGDYQKVVAASRQRDEGFEASVEDIMSEMIARRAEIKTEADAAKMLNKLSGQRMVEQALHDDTIDARVFGEEAAVYIEGSRHHLSLGNHEMAYAALNRAKLVERSVSCPGEIIEEVEVDEYGNVIDSDSAERAKLSVGKDKYGSRKFKCTRGHSNIRPHNQLIEKCQVHKCTGKVKC